jgi:hypothetical protein
MHFSSICHSLESDVWLVDISILELLETLNLFNQVDIQTSTNSITLSKVTQHPEFIEIDAHLTAPELGFGLAPKHISKAYLSNGIENHRDLCLHIHFNEEHVSFSFDATKENKDLISSLTQCVSEVLPEEKLNIPVHKCGTTCPCCIEEKKKIRQTPTIHPLYWLLDEFAQQQQPIYFSHESNLCSDQVEITPAFRMTHEGIVHLYEAGRHISIDLTDVYNVRVHIETSGDIPFTSLTAFNSFGESTFKIRKDCADSFKLWNNILQSRPKKATT